MLKSVLLGTLARTFIISVESDVDAGGRRSPLRTAAYWGHVEIATILLQAGADPNFSNAASP